MPSSDLGPQALVFWGLHQAADRTQHEGAQFPVWGSVLTEELVQPTPTPTFAMW